MRQFSLGSCQICGTLYILWTKLSGSFWGPDCDCETDMERLALMIMGRAERNKP